MASNLWLSKVPGKRWTEIFFLAYSPFWIAWALCILVPFRLYEVLDKTGYMAVGLFAAVPCILLPLALQPKSERSKPWHRRYWVKANVWIAIFSFIGNYFWTHYFYHLLGASYTFPSWRLNDVPIALYFMTHAYFCFYHSLSNVCIRRARHAVAQLGPWATRGITGVVVFSLAYATAYGETLTIAHFPYYTFKDRASMYSLGSLFYAIYFFVSFPVFFWMDEEVGQTWSLVRAVNESLASGMLVTLFLDFWKLAVGGLGDYQSQGLIWAGPPR